MISTLQKRSAGHFRHQSSDSKTSGDKITRFIDATTSTRIDMLAFDPEITGLLHVTDDYVSILELPRITTKDNGDKVISGVIGTPSDHGVYSVDATMALKDFFSWDILEDGKPYTSPYLACGPSIREYLASKCDNPEEVKDKIDGRGTILTENDDTDIGCVTLPCVLPLCHNKWLLEGSLDEPEVQESLAELHDLASLWGLAILGQRYFQPTIGSNKKCHPHFKLICPTLATNPKWTADLSVKIVRKGILKVWLDDEVDKVLKQNQTLFYTEHPELYTNTTNTSGPDNATNPSDPGSTPDPSDPPPSTIKVAIPDKFAKFIALVKVLFAIPTFDAAGDIIDLTPATLSHDLKYAIESSSSVKDLSRSIINIITHLFNSEVKQSRDFILATSIFTWPRVFTTL